MICPACKTKNIPDKSLFCNMCGVNLKEAKEKEEEELIQKYKVGELPLVDKSIVLGSQQKTIQVWCKDITDFEEDIDLLTISAFSYSYVPTPSSLIGALYSKYSINVEEMAKKPFLDLRENIGCWISEEITVDSPIRRIGGVEIPANLMKGKLADFAGLMIKVIQSYMHLLDIMTERDSSIKTIVLPLIGTGDLNLDHNLMVYPLIGEMVQLLSRNKCIEKVIFIERKFEKAKLIADAIKKSYNIQTESGEINTGSEEKNVFISYTEKGDRYVAEMIGSRLSERGIPFWFAPKDVQSGDYATEIVKGIKNCTHFICIISENSMKSTHVINEVDLAFKRLHDGVKIIPFHLDNAEVEPAFEYYLSRMNWIFNNPPPLEKRIEDLVNIIT